VKVFIGTLLASLALLGILKGTTVHGLDLESAKPCLFSAINLLKQMSIQNNDIPAKTVHHSEPTLEQHKGVPQTRS
jgi:hypothetical protein